MGVLLPADRTVTLNGQSKTHIKAKDSEATLCGKTGTLESTSHDGGPVCKQCEDAYTQEVFPGT